MIAITDCHHDYHHVMVITKVKKRTQHALIDGHHVMAVIMIISDGLTWMQVFMQVKSSLMTIMITIT